MDDETSAQRTRQVVAALGEERYRELLASLRQQLPALAALIGEGAGSDTIRAEAHRLRGAAASLGAQRQAAALAELENGTGAVAAGWSERLIDLARDHDDEGATNR